MSLSATNHLKDLLITDLESLKAAIWGLKQRQTPQTTNPISAIHEQRTASSNGNRLPKAQSRRVWHAWETIDSGSAFPRNADNLAGFFKTIALEIKVVQPAFLLVVILSILVSERLILDEVFF